MLIYVIRVRLKIRGASSPHCQGCEMVDATYSLPHPTSIRNLGTETICRGERGKLARGVSWDGAYSSNLATWQVKTEISSEKNIVHMFELSTH